MPVVWFDFSRRQLLCHSRRRLAGRSCRLNPEPRPRRLASRPKYLSRHSDHGPDGRVALLRKRRRGSDARNALARNRQKVLLLQIGNAGVVRLARAGQTAAAALAQPWSSTAARRRLHPHRYSSYAPALIADKPSATCHWSSGRRVGGSLCAQLVMARAPIRLHARYLGCGTAGPTLKQTSTLSAGFRPFGRP